jgi:hypothetical protein
MNDREIRSVRTLNLDYTVRRPRVADASSITTLNLKVVDGAFAALTCEPVL